VVALVIAGGWVGSQRQTISTLEQETLVLRKRLDARLAAGDAGSTPGKPAPPAKAAKDKEPIDWKKLAGELEGMNRGGGAGDMRAMMKLQKRLMSMDRDELAAALQEIGALDLPPESRSMLEGMLLGPLVQKDPEFALTTFADRLNTDPGGSMTWQLSNAMREWTKKDPAAATAWFDRQIAAGTFESKSLDGKSRGRMQFESTLIETLISSDPSAASARLAALPADQRSEVLTSYSGSVIKDEDQAAFADLVRSQIPEKDQAKTLAQRASQLAWGDGYDKVTAYMDRIKASPAERAAVAEQTAETKIQMLSQNQKITRETIDSLREWTTAQAPAATDSATGKALANATRNGKKMDYAEAADLAVQYHATSGNDDVLVKFLDGSDLRNNKEKAGELAALISDEKRRDRILKKLK
jgi:hypothetical protein